MDRDVQQAISNVGGLTGVNAAGIARLAIELRNARVLDDNAITRIRDTMLANVTSPPLDKEAVEAVRKQIHAVFLDDAPGL